MDIFQQGDFIANQNATPDSIAEKRRRIESLLPRFGRASSIGEGLTQLVQGIGSGISQRRIDRIEDERQGAAAAQFDSLFGGGGGPLSILGPRQVAQRGAGGGNQAQGGQPQPTGGQEPVAASPVRSGSGPDMAALQQAAANPFLTPQQRGVVANMIQQRQAEQAAARSASAAAASRAAAQNDPLRLAQLEGLVLSNDQKRLDIENARNGLGGDPAKVQSSVVLDDGTSVLIMSDGSRRVLSPTGELVQGQSAADAVLSAREFTVDNQQAIFGARRRGDSEVRVDMGGEVAREAEGGKLQARTELGGAAAAAVAAGAATGKSEAEARANLPNATAKAGQAIDLIDSVINDPSLSSITGIIQGNLPPLTQGGVDLNTKFKQLQGKVFLEAFETLKGGGQITEVEGRQATAAIARLDRAQSVGAIKTALTELRDIVQTGIGRAEQRAGAAPQGGNDAAPSTFEAFAADPSAQAAAAQFGVTLEEMWAIKQGLQ